MRLLLLHPPLLSPVVLSRLASRLGDEGHDVAVPDLRTAVASGDVGTWWSRAGDAAVTGPVDGVLAHSGAGVLAPVVCARSRATTVVLVDAALPATRGSTRTAPDVRRSVAALSVDGVLPPWPRWWDDATLEELVPDPTDRAALSSEAPSLPEALYDVDVPAPDGWEPARRAYLRLSPAYEAHARSAETRGWTTARRTGRHLDLLSRAGEVATVVADLLAGGDGSSAGPQGTGCWAS